MRERVGSREAFNSIEWILTLGLLLGCCSLPPSFNSIEWIQREEGKWEEISLYDRLSIPLNGFLWCCGVIKEGLIQPVFQFH